MPPMISDDESDSVDVPDQIPAVAKAAKAVEEDDEEDDDEEDGEPDEYRVEEIRGHDFTKEGTVIYEIKWLGYEAEEDRTWEPVENLENAKDLLDAYHRKIGGVPEPKPKSSRKKGPAPKAAATSTSKRSASAAFDDSPAPANTTTKKRGRKSGGSAANGIGGSSGVALGHPTGKRDLPIGSWEDHITRVVSILEGEVPPVHDAKGRVVKADLRELTGLLEWNDDGPKTQHKLKVLRQKCPQKLLDYYEQHLRLEPFDKDDKLTTDGA